MLSNLKLTDKKLSIQIKNQNIKPSFVNGLRRVMNAEIEIIAFDIDTFNVSKNTSTINNSILEQRIGLIPINNYKSSIFTNSTWNTLYCMNRKSRFSEGPFPRNFPYQNSLSTY